MLFTVAARLHGVDGNGTKHRICQGCIPSELENDSFFDINKRNLMVIDDQMENAGGDKRIVNLFTRGLIIAISASFTSYRTYSIKEK